MLSVLLFNFKKFKFAFLDLSRPFYVDDWQKSKPCVKLSYRYVFLYWTRSPSPPSPSTAQQSKKGKKKEKFSRKDLAARKSGESSDRSAFLKSVFGGTGALS